MAAPLEKSRRNYTRLERKIMKDFWIDTDNKQQFHGAVRQAFKLMEILEELNIAPDERLILKPKDWAAFRAEVLNSTIG